MAIIDQQTDRKVAGGSLVPVVKQSMRVVEVVK